MIKEANPLAALFGKIAPRLINLSSKAINPITAKAVGSTAGALGGGILGASQAPEGEKSKGFLVGATAGGLAGYFGGKTYAGFGAGGADSARILGLGNNLKQLATEGGTIKDSVRGAAKYISQNWATPEHLRPIPTKKIDGPLNRPMLSFTKKAPIQQMSVPQGSAVTRAIGNAFRGGMAIADPATAAELGIKGNVATRTMKVLGREANESMHYIKDGYRYRRSLLGKALGAGMGSGIGFGVLEGATTTNPDGSPAPLHKKLFKGTSTALGWGLASPIMGAKMLAYDVPKTLINPES
jgi:hypothetical protein